MTLKTAIFTTTFDECLLKNLFTLSVRQVDP